MSALHPAAAGTGKLTRAGRSSAILLLLSALTSCSVLEDYQTRNRQREQEKQLAAVRAETLATHATWRKETSAWKSKIYRNKDLLARANAENTSVEIALKEQRGLLLVDGAIAMDFPVATGKKSHPTPTGSFTIRGKEKDYSSNLYGKILGADGAVLVADADTRVHVIPEGAVFDAAKMPYWMRLTDTGVGMHVGYVPGRPASHGCIRLKREVAPQIFELTKIGTPVVIADQAPALLP